MNEYENSGELFFSFPRAFVFSRSHAPLFFLVPTRRRGNAFSTPQCRGPQARKDGMLARPESVPTPARGNQKKMGRWRVPNRFPRRRVGTRNPAYCRGEPACSPSFVIARKRNFSRSHAGAWEPETQRIVGANLRVRPPLLSHGKETWFLRCP